MRIGILTLPLHTNYGGILQAYALYTVLSSMGHQVSLIDGKMYEISSMREKLSVFLPTTTDARSNGNNNSIY